jgi:hydrocephalus-inducing protein
VDERGNTVQSDDEVLPFAVEPSYGSIEAGESVLIAVRFSPTDVGDYSFGLRCSTPGVSAAVNKLAISVSGMSQRPLCHFELPDSDYLTHRRTAEPSQPQFDINTRVIEFETCGVNSKAVKRFYIVNPTDFNYEVEWQCLDGPKVSSVFRCLTEKGVVQSGKKFEVVFEYTPEAIETKVCVFLRLENYLRWSVFHLFRSHFGNS